MIDYCKEQQQLRFIVMNVRFGSVTASQLLQTNLIEIIKNFCICKLHPTVLERLHRVECRHSWYIPNKKASRVPTGF